jgi:hypothetical protein
MNTAAPKQKPKQMKIELHDTFNRHIISRHRSLLSAAKAQLRHSRAVKRANGQSSYIPTAIRNAGNAPLSEQQEDELMDAKLRIEALGLTKA